MRRAVMTAAVLGRRRAPSWALRAASGREPTIDLRLNQLPDGLGWWNGQIRPINTILQEARAGTVTQTDLAGNVLSVAANTLRMCDAGLLPFESRTNSVRNNTMVGATAGVVGSGGALPTNWVLNVAGGLTTTVIGTGTENGVNYVDVRFSGTSSGTDFRMSFENSTAITAADAQVWSESFYLSVVGGSKANISDFHHYMGERTAAGAAVTSGSSANFTSTLDATQRRFPYTRTLAGGGTVARVTPEFQWVMSNGAAIDITLRFGMPQMELGAFVSPVIPTSTVAVTAAASNVSFISTTGQRLDRGTWVLEWASLGPIGVTGITGPSMFVDANNYIAFQRTSGNKAQHFVNNPTNAGAVPSTNSVVANTAYKAAYAYEANNCRARYSASLGADPADDVLVGMPTGAFVTYIGARNAAAQMSNELLTRITYFDEALPTADLDALRAA
jgi:hypothetical protein